MLGVITFFCSLGVEGMLLDMRNNDIKYLFMNLGIILINFLITVKLRKIPAIERPSLKKTSVVSIIIIYIFCVYCYFDSMNGFSLLETILQLLVVCPILTLMFYLVFREFFYSYLLLWLDYFFGTSELCENKKVRAEVTKYNSSHSYYWVLANKKTKLKPSNELVKKYYKGNVSRTYTKTMMIKKGLISKRLIVTEIKN